MKQTKEQLLVEVTKLGNACDIWAKKDEVRRKEFSKAFDWYESGGSYNYNNQKNPRSPSWEEIFVKVGKLLVVKDFYDFEGNVSELECKLEDLEKRLLKNVNPNL